MSAARLRGTCFFTRPVGLVTPDGTQFPFTEECTDLWVDLSHGLTDDAISQIIDLADFSAHTYLQLAFHAQEKEG